MVSKITFRHATEQDLTNIVQMLADDVLGKNVKGMNTLFQIIT